DDQSPFPFCSKKCRDVDFFRWSEGRYAIVEELDPRIIELQRLDQEGEDD
ncbi:MAG: DNA gyrase inhibitor YacG, partial [Planctomycetaceae bacterium]|nr:DNA gyrase inhibitor YacG [Planctomycetaceae bacterium]